MVSLSTANTDPQKLIWDELDRVRAGMLGLKGESFELQPMAPNLDLSARSIWFYTRKSGDLARSIGPGSEAIFVVVGKDHDFHAVLKGTIEVNHDRARIEEYWSSIVEAWYHDGKDDPDLTMLQFRPRECSFWASTGNMLSFGWEIAKANLDPDKEPDVGVHKHIAFA